MKVLFSPVGTADPLTMLGDGPLLHIVRNERPEVVVLYLTPAMRCKEDAEHIYTAALGLMAEELGLSLDVRTIDSRQDAPHRFDVIIPEFREALEGVREEFPDAKVLLNVSSGTPSMEAALLELDAFGIYNTQAIQVVTPAQGANEPGTREDLRKAYPLDELWDLNPDREPDSPNRCRVVETPNFKQLIVRDNIRALVEKYDYAGAVSILDAQEGAVSDEAERLIRGCDERLRLNSNGAIRYFKGTSFTYDPGNRLAEYVRYLETLYLQGRWADYIRAMTPALSELLLAHVRARGLRDDDWLIESKGLRICVRKAKENPTVCKALSNASSSKCLDDEGNNPFVISAHLIAVLEQQVNESNEKSDTEVLARFQGLRSLEEAVRNTLAHTITATGKELLDKQSRERRRHGTRGLTIDESIEALFSLCPGKVERGLYARINERIVELL